MGDLERRIADILGVPQEALSKPSSAPDAARKEAKPIMPYYCSNCEVPVGEDDIYRQTIWPPGPGQREGIFHKTCDKEVVKYIPTA